MLPTPLHPAAEHSRGLKKSGQVRFAQNPDELVRDGGVHLHDSSKEAHDTCVDTSPQLTVGGINQGRYVTTYPHTCAEAGLGETVLARVV